MRAGATLCARANSPRPAATAANEQRPSRSVRGSNRISRGIRPLGTRASAPGSAEMQRTPFTRARSGAARREITHERTEDSVAGRYGIVCRSLVGKSWRPRIDGAAARAAHFLRANVRGRRKVDGHRTIRKAQKPKTKITERATGRISRAIRPVQARASPFVPAPEASVSFR